MKTFYQIIYKACNTFWSGQDAEPDGFSSVEESVKQAVQLANSMLWNSYAFPFKIKKEVISLLPTVKAYENPNGQILSVWIDGKTSYLNRISDFDFIDEMTGTPTSYYINDDNQLCLYPIPDKDMVLNVRYQNLQMAKNSLGVEKNNLELETDVLNIPEYLEDLYLQALVPLSVVNFLQDSTDENYAPYQVTYEKTYQNLIREVRGSVGETTIKI